MNYEPFLIAPIGKGLNTYYKPFLLGNDAFPELDNCYQFRGKIRKREGNSSFGRLPIWKTLTGITNASPPVVTSAAHGLLTGDMVWLESVTGGLASVLSNVAYSITKLGANTFSLQNLNTGSNIAASGTATAGNIYLPVVGLRTFLVPRTSDEQSIAFHPKQASIFSGGSYIALQQAPDGSTITWTGTKDNFFDSCNYAYAMWATNNVDKIKYWNGTLDSGGTGGWSVHSPALNAGGTLLNAVLLIIPYKGRLIVLNTLEGTDRFVNRARWCQIGTPYTVTDATHVPPSPFGVDANAWKDDIPGKGGYIDADTSENIVACEIVNDTLIVGFQFSTWKLVYTGNEVLPFIWQRINTSLGCEAPFSTIVMDDSVLMLSRRGIIRSDINETVRMDMDIPDIIQNFENGNVSAAGLTRCFGLRDYDKQIVYWTWGDAKDSPPSQTPDRMLVYNYVENTWSTFSLSYSCLGRYKLSTSNVWSTWTTPWQGDSSSWDEDIDQSDSLLMLGGRVDSKIYEILDDTIGTDNGTNYNFTIATKRFSPYLQQARMSKLAYVDLYFTNNAANSIIISDITKAIPAVVTTTIAHGLSNGSTVSFINCAGMPTLNNQLFTVGSVTSTTFTLVGVDTTALPTYTINSGSVILAAEVTVQHFIEDNDSNPVTQRRVITSLDNTSAKYTRVFLGAEALFHQLKFTLSTGVAPFLAFTASNTIDNELADAYKGAAPFELQAIIIYTKAVSRKKG